MNTTVLYRLLKFYLEKKPTEKLDVIVSERYVSQDNLCSSESSMWSTLHSYRLRVTFKSKAFSLAFDAFLFRMQELES